MQAILKNFADLGRRRLAILAGVAASLLLVLLLGLGAVTKSDFAPVYQNLSFATAGSVQATLVGAGFTVDVSEDGSSVLVPRSDLARARMALAESGIPIDGDPGWELFDQQSGLAMNSFMQKVNRLRAMEGELARSIQTLDGIKSARVHLVMPEREPFSREAPSPRASVIARPTSGRTISRKQAISIRNLVSSAVAELDLRRVTVLSANGETILAESGDDDTQVTLQSTKAVIEDRLAQEIQDILTARVGAGNARIRVNADLTTHREVVVQHSFDPDQQVVRSTESNSENQSGQDGSGNVGVENNIPQALADPDAGPSSQRTVSGETVTYEIGNTRREVVREAGEVRRLSVAVLVNGIYSVDGSDITYSERSPEELVRLTELVKTAVGYDTQRGDSISVDSMRFIDYSMEVGDPVRMTMGQQVSQNIVSIIRSLLALAIVGLVIAFGVRPALRYLSEAALIQNAKSNIALDGPGGETPKPAVPQIGDTPGVDKPGDLAVPFNPLSDTTPHDYIETVGIKGNLLRARIEGIQRLTDEKPEDVLRVLKSWLKSEAEA